tara:strand:+ start:8970 stop:9593 length:624 start_codon:yes stop_codon:yes gene_type:complete
MNNFPDAPSIPIIISIVKFTESMMMMDSKSGDLILGKHTDTYDDSTWDFKTPKLLFPYLNTPNRIAKKNGITLFDPMTGQKGWVVPDAILNNMIILSAHDLEIAEFAFNLDAVLSDNNWEGIFLDETEMHEHIVLISGMIHKKITPMFDAISSLFGTGHECDVCGCPYEERDAGVCHGCGIDIPPSKNKANNALADIVEYNLGKEWE